MAALAYLWLASNEGMDPYSKTYSAYTTQYSSFHFLFHLSSLLKQAKQRLDEAQAWGLGLWNGESMANVSPCFLWEFRKIPLRSNSEENAFVCRVR